MSVLESFFILFESDASDSAKDVDKLNDALDDTEQQANDTTDAADDAGQSFVGLSKKALGAAGGVLALVSAVAGLAAKAQQLDRLGKFSDLVGENIEDVDAWSESVIRAGGTAEGFRSSIEMLNEKLVDASIRGQNEITPFFNQLGVRILDTNDKLKPTLKLLPELSSAFEGISKQQALGLGKKLGLDLGTIALLQKGRDAVDDMIERQKRLGVANAESAELSAKFNNSMEDFKQISGFAAQSLVVAFIPAMTWMIDRFNDVSLWMRENKAVVFGFFIGLGVVAIPTLISLAAAGWAAIAPFLVMAAPFIAIAAAAGAAGVAISLVVEDVMAFIDGQSSLIGKIAEDWPIVGDIVRGLVAEIKGFFNILNTLGGFLIDLFFAPQKALEKMIGMFGTVKDFFGFGDGDQNIDLAKNINIGQDSLALASESPIGSQTSSSIQNSTRNSTRSTSVQTGDVIIQTQATDAEGIARDAAGSLNQQLKSTVENFDDGVLI